jgi:hypothetical protein
VDLRHRAHVSIRVSFIHADIVTEYGGQPVGKTLAGQNCVRIQTRIIRIQFDKSLLVVACGSIQPTTTLLAAMGNMQSLERIGVGDNKIYVCIQ